MIQEGQTMFPINLPPGMTLTQWPGGLYNIILANADIDKLAEYFAEQSKTLKQIAESAKLKVVTEQQEQTENGENSNEATE